MSASSPQNSGLHAHATDVLRNWKIWVVPTVVAAPFVALVASVYIRVRGTRDHRRRLDRHQRVKRGRLPQRARQTEPQPRLDRIASGCSRENTSTSPGGIPAAGAVTREPHATPR
jgi:hypothetical protein